MICKHLPVHWSSTHNNVQVPLALRAKLQQRNTAVAPQRLLLATVHLPPSCVSSRPSNVQHTVSLNLLLLASHAASFSALSAAFVANKQTSYTRWSPKAIKWALAFDLCSSHHLLFGSRGLATMNQGWNTYCTVCMRGESAVEPLLRCKAGLPPAAQICVRR